MVSDDAVDHGQPETGPLPICLRGEEGLEDAVGHVGRHAGSGITDDHFDVVARLEIGARARVRLVEVRHARLESDPPALGHRLGGIDRHVDQHLLHLAGVRLDERQVRVGARLHDNARVDALGQERHGVRDRLIHVHGLERVLAAARERQQLLGQLGRAPRLLLDGDRLAVDRIVGGRQAADVSGVAEDRSQDVVELVRDATGQGSDRLHLLRLHELGRQLLLRRSGRRGVLEGARVLDQEAEQLPQNGERSRLGPGQDALVASGDRQDAVHSAHGLQGDRRPEAQPVRVEQIGAVVRLISRLARFEGLADDRPGYSRPQVVERVLGQTALRLQVQRARAGIDEVDGARRKVQELEGAAEGALDDFPQLVRTAGLR